MKILGIDTATPVASVALVENGALIMEKIFPDQGQNSIPPAIPRANHAETLLPHIAELLNETGLSWEGVAAIAVSIGPGSFTGLRIGLSTAKGLAYGWDIPVAGVSTLLAVAHRVREWTGWICPLLDAKKKEVYAALFQRAGGKVNQVIDDEVVPPDSVLQQVLSVVKGEPCLFVGNGSRLYEDTIRDTFGAKAQIISDDFYPSIAFAVACIGEERVRGGETGLAGPLVPRYLRPSEAEIGQSVRKLSGTNSTSGLPVDKDDPLG